MQCVVALTVRTSTTGTARDLPCFPSLAPPLVIWHIAMGVGLGQRMEFLCSLMCLRVASRTRLERKETCPICDTPMSFEELLS